MTSAGRTWRGRAGRAGPRGRRRPAPDTTAAVASGAAPDTGRRNGAPTQRCPDADAGAPFRAAALLAVLLPELLEVALVVRHADVVPLAVERRLVDVVRGQQLRRQVGVVDLRGVLAGEETGQRVDAVHAVDLRG